jgi:hypothetical protein
MKTLATLLCALAALSFVACSERKTTTSDTAKLKSLHRGEMSAIASYDDAIKRFPSFQKLDLAKLRADHADSAERLRGRIVALNATPDDKAGAWGTWAEAVEKAAAAFGQDAALRALEAGEKHGQNDYEEALNDSSVDGTSKDLIRGTLLPRQQEHVKALQTARETQ